MVDSKQVEIPRGSTTLDVTIGVVRQHFVDYAIDPEEFMSGATSRW